jgi:hypothetical protein
MLLYLLTNILWNKKRFKNCFGLALCLSFIGYFVLSYFIPSIYLILIIPYDLFISSLGINNKKYLSFQKFPTSLNIISKTYKPNLNQDKISITETLDHTFKNLGISQF